MSLADTDLPDGTIVTLDRSGRFVPFNPNYTRTERAIRWLGRVLHWRRLAHFRERFPVGIAVEGSVVMSGVVRVEYTPPPGVYS